MSKTVRTWYVPVRTSVRLGKYVLLASSTYFYHAFCTQCVLSTCCFRKVRTWYVQGKNSTYSVRTWGKKYVPVQSSTRWYSTIDEYNSVRTGTYWYPTRKVCTLNLKYVLLSWFLYSVRTEYVRIRDVRTWYVHGVNSTYQLTTTKYVLGVKRTYSYREVQDSTVSR